MALQLNAGDLDARQKLAEILAKKGLFKEAIVEYKRMMDIDPGQIKRPELWRALAKIKDQQGQFDIAVEYLQQAVRFGPEDADFKKELDAEVKKQEHAAATRAATMPTTR